MKKIAWIAVILLTVGPILSLSLFFYRELKSLTKDNVLNNIQREVNIGRSNLNEFISERQGNLAEWAQMKSLQTIVLIVVGTFIFITLTIVNYILNTIRQSFSKVTDSLSGVAKGQYQPIQRNSRFKELQEAESKYNALVTQIEQATIQLESQAKDQALWPSGHIRKKNTVRDHAT